MGNKTGKIVDKGELDLSSSKGGQREGLSTWHREGVEVTDVYEILGVLGAGQMGEVYRVRRKQENRGMHNDITRAAKNVESDGESDDGEAKKPFTKSIRKKINKSILKGGKKGQEEHIPALPVPDAPEPKVPPSPKAPKPRGILRGTSYHSEHSTSNHPSPFVKSKDEQSPGDRDDVSCTGSVSSGISDTSGKRGSGLRKLKRTIRFAREYGCKTVSTARVKAGLLDELLNEIYVMRTLDHPYILQLHEVYQVKRKVWLITELCSGGDLTSRRMNEPRVTVILEQILRAIIYMHRRGILHRDLKLENILFENNHKDAKIRLIDFGLSKMFDRAVLGDNAIGSAYTLSPEIASGRGIYTEKTEVWSIGVIAWILLAGDFPFLKGKEDMENKEKMNKLLRANYSYGVTWKGRCITDDAKTFVSKCLKKNPEDRWTVKEALEFVQNTWMPNLEDIAAKEKDKESKRVLGTATTGEHANRKLSADLELAGIDTEDIEAFCKAGLVKKAILTTMAHTVERDDVAHLREIFLLADTEDTGTISFLELKSALQKLGTNMDDETLERLFEGIDQDRSGQIHYGEFLASLVESQGLVTMERLAESFDRIDSDGKGFISHDDLKKVLGDDYNEELVNGMIEEADFKKNGQVDYDEFLQLMFQSPETGLEAAGNVRK